VFPKGKHDDQSDSTAQFLDWFKMPMPGWGIFELTRRQLEEREQRRKPEEGVDLATPPTRGPNCFCEATVTLLLERFRRLAQPFVGAPALCSGIEHFQESAA